MQIARKIINNGKKVYYSFKDEQKISRILRRS